MVKRCAEHGLVRLDEKEKQKPDASHNTGMLRVQGELDVKLQLEDGYGIYKHKHTYKHTKYILCAKDP